MKFVFPTLSPLLIVRIMRGGGGRGWGFWAGQDHGLDQAGPAVDRKCLKSFVAFGGAG